jgi:hypothetical protein
VRGNVIAITMIGMINSLMGLAVTMVTKGLIDGATGGQVVDPHSLGHLGTPVGTVKRLTKDRNGISWLRASQPTAFGDIVVEINGKILKVIVPPSTTATVFPNTSRQRLLQPGEWVLSR